MAKIPQAVLDRCPVIPGLPVIGRGKVRDTFDLGNFSTLNGAKAMLVLASDRAVSLTLY